MSDVGCGFGQGFLWSRALSIDELVAFAER